MSRPRTDEVARFWQKVHKTPTCWYWTSAVDKDGYGLFQISQPRRTVRAHRMSYALNKGLDVRRLSEEVIRHSCDIPGCVNPTHLLGGTTLDNVRDKMARGRFVVSRGNAKLTEANVRSIRERLATGETHESIAQSYGVSRPAISLIHEGRNWKHVR